MMSYFGFSQDLTPKTRQIDNKKHYCFTIEQSRQIATMLELGKYNDSLVIHLSQNVKRYELVTKKQDDIISFQATRLRNYEIITENNDRTINLLEENLKRKNKKIKRSKLQKVLLIISLTAVGVFAISK